MKRMMLSLLLGALVAASTAMGPAGAAETVRVYMSNGSFCPNPVCQPMASQDTTITVGDTVEWFFADATCYPFDLVFGQLLCYHNATSAEGEGPIESPNLSFQEQRLSYSHTFIEAGEYEYLCTLHVDATGMKAKIVVEEA